MNTPLKDQPAFPFPSSNFVSVGLTKLELFSAMAMQGFCSNDSLLQTFIEFAIQSKKTPEEVLGIRSVKMAKAVLAELEKEKP